MRYAAIVIGGGPAGMAAACAADGTSETSIRGRTSKKFGPFLCARHGHVSNG